MLPRLQVKNEWRFRERVEANLHLRLDGSFRRRCHNAGRKKARGETNRSKAKEATWGSPDQRTSKSQAEAAVCVLGQ